MLVDSFRLPTAFRWPILHRAIWDNNYDAVHFLLERGADKRLQNQNNGLGATEFAAFLGYEPIKLLLLAGQPTSQNLKNIEGCRHLEMGQNALASRCFLGREDGQLGELIERYLVVLFENHNVRRQTNL